MTMKSARNTVAAGRFKAQCLGFLDQVAQTGETLIITKRGKPVARLVPVEQKKQPSLRGSVKVCGDIVGPLGEIWEAEE
jgi:prevent-host-death family protein